LFWGVTARETGVALVTVRVAVGETMVPDVAVIIEVPAARALARPFVGAVLLMPATVALEEFQVTCELKSCALLSVNVPVALNCCVVPGAIDMVAGVTAMETRESVTVRVAVPLTVPEVAVMLVDPTAMAVAKPPVAIVATLEFDELQVTELLKSLLLPSLNLPVAVNCC